MSETDYTDIEDVVEVVEQPTANLPEDLVCDPDVVDGHKDIYTLFIEESAKPKKKAVSTLSGYLNEDVDIQKDLLNDYVYSVLKSMCSDGDIRVKCNEYHIPYVRDDKTVVVECENNHLRSADITKAIAIKIVRHFPSVSEILSDIRKETAKNVPVLPLSAIRIINKCWKAPCDDDEYFLPYVFRERLCNIIQSIIFRGVTINTDTIVKTIKDVASQTLYTIHKKKLVKDVLPSNAKLGVEMELFAHLKELTANTMSDDQTIREEAIKSCLEQIRALGF